MAEFKPLEHTADTGFEAWGEDLYSLLQNAAWALTNVVLDPAGARPGETRQLTATGGDREELLVNWLNEVLYLLDGARFVPAAIEVERLEDLVLQATVQGEPRDDERHPPRLVVKAVTFHQLAVFEREEGWGARVFLDI